MLGEKNTFDKLSSYISELKSGMLCRALIFEIDYKKLRDELGLQKTEDQTAIAQLFVGLQLLHKYASKVGFLTCLTSLI